MTEVGTTETDLTNEDNRKQARWELDRAMLSSDYAQCSAWAVRWGRSALDALDDPATDVTEDLQDELKAAENELSSTEIILSDTQDDLRDLETAIRRAVKEMRRVAELIEDDGSAIDAGHIREIADELEGNL